MSISGKKISAKIGIATVVGLVGWTVDEDAQELDGTTAADGGYENPDDGVWGATIQIKGILDIETGVYTPIRRGTLIANLNLYRDIGDVTPAYTFPLAKVFKSTQGAEIRGRFEVSATIKSKGVYAYNEPS